MNLLISFLTGHKERLTPRNVKFDVIVIAALVLIIAVVGTIVVHAQPSSETQAAVTVDDPRRAILEPGMSDWPSSMPSASATASSSASPESTEPSASASPTPTASDTASPSASAEVENDKTMITAVEPAVPAVAVPPAPAPAVTAPNKAVTPSTSIPSIPAVPSIPAAPAPAPEVPSSPYPVSSIPVAQYRTTIQLNLRSGPGSNYDVLGNGTTGTTVTTTGRASGIWYEVTLRGQTGWMSSQYLQKIETGANSVASLQAFAGSKLGNDTQLQCLITLWNRESNWNYTAINPDFSPMQPATPFYQAYGIAQAAPGNKMSTFGSDWETNPRTQILWGLDYISGRYGTPCKALDHSYAKGWY